MRIPVVGMSADGSVHPARSSKVGPRGCPDTILSRGGNFMANLSGVVQQLKQAHAEAQGEVKRLGAALAALGSLTGRSPTGKRRTLSAAARRKISLAQKARWAKRNAIAQTPTAKRKRTISAAGRRRIAPAQRARWAKVKAGKK